MAQLLRVFNRGQQSGSLAADNHMSLWFHGIQCHLLVPGHSNLKHTGRQAYK